MKNWESLLEKKITEIATSEDPSHDVLHFKRVVNTAKQLGLSEKAKMEVIIPAAWLHDYVNVPKNDPRRSIASKLSADEALIYLKSIEYPQEYFPEIAHAIEAHSFSANIECKSLEAKIVQDADRLDGLGAIGIARCFATSALLKRPFYNIEDSFCETREPNDQVFTIDHFYKKLFKTAETLKTEAGRTEGQRRVQIMQKYLKDLSLEI